MSIHIGITETKCESQWNLKTTPYKIAIASIEDTKSIEANRVIDCEIKPAIQIQLIAVNKITDNMP